jgi:hypothetical protein
MNGRYKISEASARNVPIRQHNRVLHRQGWRCVRKLINAVWDVSLRHFAISLERPGALAALARVVREQE